LSPIKKLHHLYRASAAAKALFDDLTELEETEEAAAMHQLGERIEQKIAKHVTGNLGPTVPEEQLS
jgi:hypothetical protein